MSDKKFNKSRYIPFGVILIGNDFVELDNGKASTKAFLQIGNYNMTFFCDFQDVITLEERKMPLTISPRQIRMDKLKFEQIIEKAFNEMWEE